MTLIFAPKWNEELKYCSIIDSEQKYAHFGAESLLDLRFSQRRLCRVWDVTPSGPEEARRCFGATYCLSFWDRIVSQAETAYECGGITMHDNWSAPFICGVLLALRINSYFFSINIINQMIFILEMLPVFSEVTADF